MDFAWSYTNIEFQVRNSWSIWNPAKEETAAAGSLHISVLCDKDVWIFHGSCGGLRGLLCHGNCTRKKLSGRKPEVGDEREREKRSTIECIIHLRKPLGEGAQLQETTKCAVSSLWTTVTLPIPIWELNNVEIQGKYKNTREKRGSESVWSKLCCLSPGQKTSHQAISK